MRCGKQPLFYLALPTLAAVALAAGLWRSAERIQQSTEAHRPALIYPDYSSIVIPPNLAPLNLRILESGHKFCLRLSTTTGVPVEVWSANGIMRIRPDEWHTLLRANVRGELRMDIYVKRGNRWVHFDTVRNRIAADEIDPYVVYRFIPPIYNTWDQISLRQRDLRSFAERVVFDNQRSTDRDGNSVGNVCINCHTFLNHRTDQMVLQVRPARGSQIPAMIVVRHGRAEKVDTRTGQVGAATYTSWHPSGKLLVFSRNSISQTFHEAGAETREVVDKDSDLVLYQVDTGEVHKVPQISRPDRLETWPAWSPDGRYLYFCSAPFWMDKKDAVLFYDKVQYDLNRIAYDSASGRWGEVETVVAAAQLGKSISLPQISPDGRFLMFCGHAYGSFPIFQPSSDLYLLDLSHIQAPPVQFRPVSSTSSGAASERTTQAVAARPEPKPLAVGRAAPRKLDEINSDSTDSYHSWSSNSRWVIFASKREDGIFARLYIAHLEADGRFSKPFVMPQEDPAFYSRCLMTYNRPELLLEPVTVSATELARAVNSNASRVRNTGVVPSGSTPMASDEPWWH